MICYQAAAVCQHTYYYLDGKEFKGKMELYAYKGIPTKGLKRDERKRLTTEALEEAVEETVLDPLANCLHTIKMMIRRILKETDADDYQLYLTGKNNFRDKIATTVKYKGNRDDKPKPDYLVPARDYVVDRWGAVVIEGQEADDQLAIDQYADPDGTVIATGDKDLLMVPGLHYNWGNDEGVIKVSRVDGLRWFWEQMLQGDTADNIKGIAGIAKKTAHVLLKDIDSPWDMYLLVAMKYAVAFDDPEYRMVENGRLLWMREYDDQMWELPKHECKEI